MNYYLLVLLVLIPHISKSQTPQNLNKNLHHSINATGGEIAGKEISVSYSIGQVNYLSYEGDSSHVTEGVQQPLIISIRSIIPEKEEESFTMAAYPNPVTNYFIIEASAYTNRSLKYHLTDLNGNFIKEGRIEDPGATVDISGLAVAVYVINITDNNRHIKTFRIIKK